MDALIIDSFAGGGGASLGIAWATGRAPDIAINHDAGAIAMHERNHPSTHHVLEDVWKTDLAALVDGRPVGLLWASPDCKHFSRAKGAKPVEKSIRSLAWIVCRWADQVRPRVIIVENVREFEGWGPLVPRLECRRCDWKGTEGQAKLARKRVRCPRCDSLRLRQTDEMFPDPDRKGLTFKRWVGRLRNLGYEVDWRVLNAADFGSPTNRRRLFLVARCDGQAIEWPEPTHSNPKKKMPGTKPWRTAAECIDWSIECPSIFTRKRPLAEATMRRIAMGIKRYVLENEEPFIVRCNHGGEHFRGQPLDKPFCTVTSSRDAHGLVVPMLSKYHGSKSPNDSRCHQLELPFKTLDTQPRFALVSAFLAKHFGGMVGVGIDTPLPTTTTRGTQNQLVSATLVQTGYGERKGQKPRAMDIENPLGTVVAGGSKHGLVAANLIHMNHGEKQWNSAKEPLRTVTSNNHAALVYSFLIRYFGTLGLSGLDEPLPTSTTKDRNGLVTVTVEGEPYVIVDIGMRMLTPRELARAQGFPDLYILTGTKTNQVARIGNSVCPQVAEALVRVNCMAELVTV